MSYLNITDHAIELEKRLFLSYSQNDTPIADIIYEKLNELTNGLLKISRYTQVQYKNSFKAFMNSIEEHDFVLCVVSDSYLKSKNCMYEVGEIIKDHNFKNRLLFVVLSESDRKYYKADSAVFAPAHIYGFSENRLKYTEYWQSEYENLRKKIEEISNPVATRKEANSLYEIKKILENDLGAFLEYLVDYNGSRFDDLYTNDFEEILKWIYPNWENVMFVNCQNYRALLGEALSRIVNITNTDYNQIALNAMKGTHEQGLAVFADNIIERKQRYTWTLMNGVMGQAFSTGKIINISDVCECMYYCCAVPETKSEIAIPIILNGNIIGVINSESEDIAHYSKEVEKSLVLVANHLAIALNRMGYKTNIPEKVIPYVHMSDSRMIF